MLELKNLVFEVPADDGGTKRIIDDLSLTIPDDRFTVITGPNGGGKSTLAKLIMGIEEPTSGQILFNGEDITDKSITERARLGIGYGFQQPARFRGMKVKKLLDIAAGKKLPMLACNEYLSKVGLCSASYLTREVDKSLSGGEVKRIEIATNFSPRPEAGHLRRARGRHRPVELRPSHRDVPRHPRGPRRALHRHHLAPGAHHFPGRRDRASARRPGGRGGDAGRAHAAARVRGPQPR